MVKNYTTWKNNKKRKYRRYMRECQVKISKHCTPIYKTDVKRQPVGCCPACRYRLKILGYTLYGTRRYEKMIKKPEIIETAEWHDHNKVTVVHTEKMPVKEQNGEIIGDEQSITTVHTTREQLEQGIMGPQKRLAENEHKYRTIMQKLENTKKTVRTAELVKLDKNLQKLQELKEIKQMEEQVKNLKEMIEKDQEIIGQRIKVLEQAPQQEGADHKIKK